MVESQIAARGIRDERVLRAMREVPREEFVPVAWRAHAWDDSPLPIGEGQTISQPFIVALMAEAAAIGPGDRVLEVGAGSGYATAVLSRLAREVFAIERHPGLAEEARARLAKLGAANARVEAGDGTKGWPAHAPFDAIIVSAGGTEIPPALVEQLAPGGRLVIPVGAIRREQRLLRLVRRGADEVERTDLGPVQFVPLVADER